MAFLIMPLFALANSGVSLAGLGIRDLAAPLTLATALGLLVGKPLGIIGFTAVAVRMGVSTRPGDASWSQILGIGVLAGIGFTVALFIAALAYPASRERRPPLARPAAPGGGGLRTSSPVIEPSGTS